MKKNHSVFILGAGYLGLPLAWQLHNRGISVMATRTNADTSLPFHIQKWDADSKDVLNPADTWIFLLPPNVNQDYAGTVNGCLKQAKHLGVSHFILGSSTGVYGNDERECNENSTLNPQTENAQKIVLAENYALNSALPNIDILRFAGLFDDERHPINYLLRSGKPIQAASSKVNLIHRQDAVLALLHACLNPQGQRIRNIVAPEHPSKEIFYRHEAKRLGLSLPDIAKENTASNKRIITSLYHDFPTPQKPILV